MTLCWEQYTNGELYKLKFNVSSDDFMRGFIYCKYAGMSSDTSSQELVKHFLIILRNAENIFFVQKYLVLGTLLFGGLEVP